MSMDKHLISTIIIFVVSFIGPIMTYILDNIKTSNEIDIDDVIDEFDDEEDDELLKIHYCEYCGSKIDDKETNCKNCGAPVKG